MRKTIRRGKTARRLGALALGTTLLAGAGCTTHSEAPDSMSQTPENTSASPFRSAEEGEVHPLILERSTYEDGAFNLQAKAALTAEYNPDGSLTVSYCVVQHGDDIGDKGFTISEGFPDPTYLHNVDPDMLGETPEGQTVTLEIDPNQHHGVFLGGSGVPLDDAVNVTTEEARRAPQWYGPQCYKEISVHCVKLPGTLPELSSETT